MRGSQTALGPVSEKVDNLLEKGQSTDIIYTSLNKENQSTVSETLPNLQIKFQENSCYLGETY